MRIVSRLIRDPTRGNLVGVHYTSDIHKARDLCIEAAADVDRILTDPTPACLLRDFNESSVDLEVRFRIRGPMNGRADVTSELPVNIWDKFAEHRIEIPYPQRDLHLRSSNVRGFGEDAERLSETTDDYILS